MRQPLPCPVCPDEPGRLGPGVTSEGWIFRRHWVECCHCGVRTKPFKSEWDAISAWDAMPRKKPEPKPEPAWEKDSEDTHENESFRVTIRKESKSKVYMYAGPRTYTRTVYVVTIKRPELSEAEGEALRRALAP